MSFLKKMGDAGKKMTDAAQAQLNANWEKQRDWYRRAPFGAVTVRSYKENEHRKLETDIKNAAEYGWSVEQMSSTTGHTNIGRTATRVVLTGGLGLLFGTSRTKGAVMMKFIRDQEAADSS